MAAFGLDFGTTNSLAAMVVNDRALVFTEGGRPIPSVVQYQGGEVTVGARAKSQLKEARLGVVENIVRSPKRFLGRGLPVYVQGVERAASDVAAEVLRHVRSVARARDARLPFEEAVMTIPVTFDGLARRELRDAARKAGLDIVQFVHEPLAALYGYVRGRADRERLIADWDGKLVLVFDWGGGTLDLTLCRISGGTIAQIQNRGDDEVGGDQFDARLRLWALDRHAELTGVDVAAEETSPGAAAKLLEACEQAKMNLSAADADTIFVPRYLRRDDQMATMAVPVTTADLVSATRDLVDRGMGHIDGLLESLDLPDAAISLCLATGGMVKMPYIRQRLIERFGPARVPELPNGELIIAEGAAWIAADRRRLKMAKPFEVLHADDVYIPIVRAGTQLPTAGSTHRYPLSMYCVDPTDGFARLLFARPLRAEAHGPRDLRDPYVCLLCAVDSNAEPLHERVELEITIDHDLVATVEARSSLTGDVRRQEIHDLEFGLSLNGS